MHSHSTDDAEAMKLVQKYVQVLGIDAEAMTVYLAMLKLGLAPALQIAKATGISRTQTYRHIEQLQAFGLASAEQLSYGSLFRALPLENLAAAIAAREAETAAIKQNLGVTAESLRALAGSSGPQAATQHYYGLGGIKQVNWNLTKAKAEFRVFETARLTAHSDKEGRAFARRCRERFIERQLTSYNLTNAASVIAKDIEPYDPERTFIRHIDPDILTISFEMYAYDDIVTMIDFGPSQPQATEVHHPALAAMMKQLFDTIWQLGQPLEVK